MSEKNIFERIGEAVISTNGNNLVAAYTEEEKSILTGAGFEVVGILDGVSIFRVQMKTKEVVKMVEVPNFSPPWGNPPINTTPWDKPINPWDTTTTKPWTTNDLPRIMYGTGTAGDPDWMKNAGTIVSYDEQCRNNVKVNDASTLINEVLKSNYASIVGR